MNTNRPGAVVRVGASPTAQRPARSSARAASMEGARAASMEGARAMLPWLVGVVPFGMVIGMAARTADLPVALAVLTGATIYSGSAQLTAIGLLDEGAAAIVVVASVLVINARLLLYGTSIAPHWRGTRRGFRYLAAYLLVDPSFVVGMHRYRAPRAPGAHAHYLAAAVTLWVAWHAAIVAGALLGRGVPGWLPVQHAVPLFLLAEAAQSVRTRPALAAAAIAGAVAVLGTGFPLHTGLLVAVATGVAGASLVARRTP